VVSIRIDPTKHEPSKKGGPAPKGPTTVQTRVVLCDTAAGKAMPGEWLIPGHYAILDLGPDGKTFLATSARPGADRNVLKLWTVAPDGQLRPRKLTPHTDVRAGLRVDAAAPPDAANSAEVRWAAFVGADRLVSASRGGQLRVFDVDGL